MSMVTVTEVRAVADAPETWPIWQDTDGAQWAVASWRGNAPEGAVTPDAETPMPVPPCCVVGPDSAAALAMMGLAVVGDT